MQDYSLNRGQSLDKTDEMSVLRRTPIAAHKPKNLRIALGLLLLFAWSTAWGHGGRHSERVDQRDAGWLTRFDRANLVVWGIPELDEVGRARFKIFETLKGLPPAEEIVARPVSSARAKAVGIKPQLIFLFSHEEQDSKEPWHWSIGRHDSTNRAPGLEEAKAYLDLYRYVHEGRCTPGLAQILAGITHQTPDWQSKTALLDAFGLCKLELPKLSKSERIYLRSAQRRHQSGQKKAAPGSKR